MGWLVFLLMHVNLFPCLRNGFTVYKWDIHFINFFTFNYFHIKPNLFKDVNNFFPFQGPCFFGVFFTIMNLSSIYNPTRLGFTMELRYFNISAATNNSIDTSNRNSVCFFIHVILTINDCFTIYTFSLFIIVYYFLISIISSKYFHQNSKIEMVS